MKLWKLTIAIFGTAVISGASVQIYNDMQPQYRPCIANFHPDSMYNGFLASDVQELLLNDEPYDDPNRVFDTPREFALSIIGGADGDRLYVNEYTGREYYVPGSCFVYAVGYTGEPFLMSEFTFN